MVTNNNIRTYVLLQVLNFVVFACLDYQVYSAISFGVAPLPVHF